VIKKLNEMRDDGLSNVVDDLFKLIRYIERGKSIGAHAEDGLQPTTCAVYFQLTRKYLADFLRGRKMFRSFIGHDHSHMTLDAIAYSSRSFLDNKK
jgi:hypothetical protein